MHFIPIYLGYVDFILILAKFYKIEMNHDKHISVNMMWRTGIVSPFIITLGVPGVQ